MKHVVIAANRAKTGRILAQQVAGLFRGFLTVDFVAVDQGVEEIVRADLILAVSNKIAGYIARYAAPGARIAVIQRTITRRGWQMVMAVPARTRVLLVNDTLESAYAVIALLYQLGAKQIELIPYCPGLEVPDGGLIALTPDEAHLVPGHIQKVINIGNRVIDFTTFLDMLDKLDLLHKETSRIAIDYLKEIISFSPGLFDSLRSITESKRRLEWMIDVMDDGMIAYDAADQIILYNKAAEQIFRRCSWEVDHLPLKSFFSAALAEKLRGAEELRDEVVFVNGHAYLVNQYALRKNGRPKGGIFIFKKHTEIERLELKFRQDIRKKGYVAKYTFGDIIGQSERLQKTIHLAAKMARSDAVVLLNGESGTGKEMFAQAIHFNSGRRDQPFVAFNCAAVADSLIESELFGYEGGAFTGAKKSGKPGLFELADRGTIFLDEIGDISPNMQARLLRVLQEKEVIRVGGTTVKPVDSRVIAATNKNLALLVETGEFREDLYYRLNVLPLFLPPLRRRKEDIPQLIEFFLQKYGIRRDFSPAVRTALHQYHWPGNIRELKNCMEYFISVAGDPVTPEDLPFHIAAALGRRAAAPAKPELPPELNRADHLDTLLEIIRLLGAHAAEGNGVGRGRVAARIRTTAGGSEYEIRRCLEVLRALGYVVTGKGRAGNKLTERGVALYRKISG